MEQNNRSVINRAANPTFGYSDNSFDPNEDDHNYIYLATVFVLFGPSSSPTFTTRYRCIDHENI